MLWSEELISFFADPVTQVAIWAFVVCVWVGYEIRKDFR